MKPFKSKMITLYCTVLPLIQQANDHTLLYRSAFNSTGNGSGKFKVRIKQNGSTISRKSQYLKNAWVSPSMLDLGLWNLRGWNEIEFNGASWCL
jgi:hypothetical protein